MYKVDLSALTLFFPSTNVYKMPTILHIFFWKPELNLETGKKNPSVPCSHCSPPGFSVHGILQERILEWVAIPFSRGSSQPRVWNWVSHDKSGFRNHFLSNSGDLKVTHILNQDCSCSRNRSTSSSWWWFPGQPLEKNHSFWHVFHSDSFESEVKVKSLSHVWLFATPWTVAHQAPLSMGFSRQNTGVGCHFLL